LFQYPELVGLKKVFVVPFGAKEPKPLAAGSAIRIVPSGAILVGNCWAPPHGKNSEAIEAWWSGDFAPKSVP